MWSGYNVVLSVLPLASAISDASSVKAGAADADARDLRFQLAAERGNRSTAVVRAVVVYLV